MRKYLVILRQGSDTEKFFSDDHDATIDNLLVLTCEKADINAGYFAFLKRIPVEKIATRKQRSHQSWWIPQTDISAIFQYDGKNSPAGFHWENTDSDCSEAKAKLEIS